jgi:hypothetical protein
MQLKKDMVFHHATLYVDVPVAAGTKVKVQKIGKDAYLLVVRKSYLHGSYFGKDYEACLFTSNPKELIGG